MMTQVRSMPIPPGAGRKSTAMPITPRSIRPAATGGVLDIIGEGGTISRLFPGYEAREPQLRLSLAIEAAMQQRRHFAGEAGTGVGKSFAYLAPLAQAKRKAVVAVPTLALMDQLLTKDLPFLVQSGVIPGGFTYALLKGRGNYLCRQKYGEFSGEPSFSNPADAAQWPTIKEWAETTTDGDTGKLSITLPVAIKSEITASSSECLGEQCPAFASCYAERAKGIAKDSDIIVTNLAMLMLDLVIRGDSDGMASILPDGIETLVIDECHRLRESAENAFKSEVTLGRWLYIERRLGTLAKRAAEADAETKLAAEIAAAAEENRMPKMITADSLAAFWTNRADTVARELRCLLEYYAVRLTEAKESAQELGDEIENAMDALTEMHSLSIAMQQQIPASLDDTSRKQWDKLAGQLFELIEDIATIVTPRADDSIVRFCSVEQRDGESRVTLSSVPVDVAPMLRDRLWSASFYRPIDAKGYSQEQTPLTVVCVSATIAADNRLDFWRGRVGLEDASELIVGSPFDYRRNALTYVPADADRFDASTARKAGPEAWEKYTHRLAVEYGRCIMASRGRAFALFTSRALMNAVYDKLYGPLTRRNLQVLKQGDAPQRKLVEDFKAQPSVLFGVKSFWEGVDIQGEALSMVIINDLPFTPPTDPVYAAQCRLIDRQYGRGASFRMLSIPDAIIQLKQAYGRGIRSKTDRAVIAILSGRLRSKGYGASVLRSLPPAPLTGNGEDVVSFF